jgi:ferric-dicitrate binding protein FerR (iron transport regulator)
MSARPSFEAVLDECIEDLRNGRRSLAECLVRWPEHAAALEPLLRTAVAARGLAAAERPLDAARRAEFMRAIRTTPQQRQHGFLDAVASAFGMLLRPRLMLVPGAMVVAFALLLVFGGGVQAPRAEASSTLTLFSGAVEVERDGAWSPLPDGAGIPTGTRLRTDLNGRALLTFADGSTVALDPASELVIEVATVEGPRQVLLRQERGRLLHQVVPDDRPGASFAVRTSSATVSAQGTVFETVIDDDEIAVSTSEGLVEVAAGTQRLAVAPGESASVAGEVVRALPTGARGGVSTALFIDAPFAASVIGPEGRATGALPSGIAFQQIPGAFSSSPVTGTQRIQFTNVRPGEYTLLLRRTAEGGGEVRLSAGEAEQAVEVGGTDGDVLALRLVITSTGGTVRVQPVEITAVAARTVPVPQERVVVTERAKERVEELRRTTSFATPTRTATATSTPEPTATATATATRPPATATTIAVPASATPAPTVRPTVSPTPTRTPERRPEPTSPAIQPTRPPATVVPVRARPVITATPVATPRATATPSPASGPFRDFEGIIEKVLPGRTR